MTILKPCCGFLLSQASVCLAMALALQAPRGGEAWTPAVASSRGYPTALAMANRSRGFGSTTSSTSKATATGGGFITNGKQAATSSRASAPSLSPAVLGLISKPTCIQDVMHERFRDAAVLADIRARLMAGQVVVLKDAFLPELADAMYTELASVTDAWSHNEDYHADGYHFRHSNIYSTIDFPPLTRAMREHVFESNATRHFMTHLTGRDCSSSLVSGAPSRYNAGDHSLPHTDHIGQRTVAYVWHLSRNWKPEWGGALYWAQEPYHNAFHHASFNSLVLFSVTPHSAHFVTTVSPNAQEQRLAYNGWWHSSWVPTLQDPLEDLLATPQQRLQLTHAQVLAIQDLIDDPWAPRIQPRERENDLQSLRRQIMQELYPPSLASTASTTTTTLSSSSPAPTK